MINQQFILTLSEKFNDFLKNKVGIENFFKKKDLEQFNYTNMLSDN